MPFRVVDLIEVVVVDGFDPFLQRNDVIVTRHYDDGSEFQALGEMHGADRGTAGGGLNVVIEQLVGELRVLDRRTRAVQFGRSRQVGDWGCAANATLRTSTTVFSCPLES